MGLFSKVKKAVKSVGSSIGSAFSSGVSGVGSVLGAVSPLLSAVSGAYGQYSANEANSAQAARQMQFQEYMSNTAYQRSMADMRKAGLNPILAYRMGGASTPTGASAQMQNVATPAMQGMSTAMQIKQSAAQTKNIKAQTAVNYETAQKVAQDAFVREKQQTTEDKIQNRLDAETRRINADARLREQQAEIYTFLTASAKEKGRLIREHPWLKKLDIGSELIGKMLGGASSAVQIHDTYR